MKESSERLPIPVVAKKMNTTPLNVLMHIKRGLLQGVEEEGVWLVDYKSLEALLAVSGGKAEVCASGCAKKHACSAGCG